ncbi:hypothetical protein Tco_0401862 [Tanacetum coccineum]
MYPSRSNHPSHTPNQRLSRNFRQNVQDHISKKKFETPLDSPPITIIDPDDKPMWLSTRTVDPSPSSAIIQPPIPNNFRIKAWLRIKEMLRTCYGHGLTKGTIMQIFYRGLDDPTQEILVAEGICLYNTPNEALKILEDKALLKLDFSKDNQRNPKVKTIVSAGGSNINSDHAILMDKFKTLATKFDSEILIIKKELKEMRDGHRDNHGSDIYMKDDMPMCEPHESNSV